MSEDPLLRRLTDIVDGAAGRPVGRSVGDHLAAPRDGTCKVIAGYRTYVNDVLVTCDTPFKKGDRLRTEAVSD